ncbi:Uncharacterised protein [Clostridioides difficile]|nr:hypothetical protein [Clostridioides difficile]SJR96563.1 Uncharacterised protein [Clostridioides difficile]
MNILASVILVIGSFIAGRVYEYRLNLNENDEAELIELEEHFKNLKEKE